MRQSTRKVPAILERAASKRLPLPDRLKVVDALIPSAEAEGSSSSEIVRPGKTLLAIEYDTQSEKGKDVICHLLRDGTSVQPPPSRTVNCDPLKIWPQWSIARKLLPLGTGFTQACANVTTLAATTMAEYFMEKGGVMC